MEEEKEKGSIMKPPIKVVKLKDYKKWVNTYVPIRDGHYRRQVMEEFRVDGYTYLGDIRYEKEEMDNVIKRDLSLNKFINLYPKLSMIIKHDIKLQKVLKVLITGEQLGSMRDMQDVQDFCKGILALLEE